MTNRELKRKYKLVPQKGVAASQFELRVSDTGMVVGHVGKNTRGGEFRAHCALCRTKYKPAIPPGYKVDLADKLRAHLERKHRDDIARNTPMPGGRL